MSEPLTDLERAARLCEERAQDASNQAAIEERHNTNFSMGSPEAATLRIQAAQSRLLAERIRALAPDPVAEAERRLGRHVRTKGLELHGSDGVTLQTLIDDARDAAREVTP